MTPRPAFFGRNEVTVVPAGRGWDGGHRACQDAARPEISPRGPGLCETTLEMAAGESAARPTERHEILVVCTANVCRSVMAEHLLRHRLERRGLADRFVVRSAGTDVVVPAWSLGGDRQGPSSGALAVLQRRGIDVRGHTRTRVTPEVLDSADLVLAMERYHLESMANLWPPAEEKLFLLKEAAALASEAPFESSDFPQRLEELGQRRPHPRHALSLERSFDVEDPIGGDYEFYEACAAEIEESLERLMSSLWEGM